MLWMAEGLAKEGFNVKVVTSEEASVRPAMRELEKYADKKIPGVINLIKLPVQGMPSLRENVGSIDLALREVAYWRLFRTWYKHPDVQSCKGVFFLPYLDYCLYAAGLLGSPFGVSPWGGLVMRPTFHYRSMKVAAPKGRLSEIKKRLFFRVLRNKYLSYILTNDQTLTIYCSSTKRRVSKPTYFPDPAVLNAVPKKAFAKRKLKIRPEQKNILLYGAITSRKGVYELLKAASDPRFPRYVDVVLAGEVLEGKIRQLLKETWVQELVEAGRIRVIDEIIESEDEAALFAAVDVIWLGYIGHYNSSGVLAQAVAAERPVLACKEGLLGWQTETYALGKTVDPSKTLEVIAAIEQLLKCGDPRDKNKDLWRPPSLAEAQKMLAKVLAERAQ